jgi:hypothetical protein
MDAGLQCESLVKLAGGWTETDNTDDAEQREGIEMHMLVCPVCLEHVAKLNQLREALTLLPGRAAPGHLIADVRAADARGVDVRGADVRSKAP